MAGRQHALALRRPRPSFDSGRISLLLPPSGDGAIGGLTAQQQKLVQQRLQILGTRETSSSGAEGGSGGASSGARAFEDRIARNELFDVGIYEVEKSMSLLKCPRDVRPPPPVRFGDGDAAANASANAAANANATRDGRSLAAIQRESSHRLYSGSSFAAAFSLPPRLIREPPAKKLAKRLGKLRSDEQARAALSAQCEQHVRDIYAEALKAVGGQPKDFIQRNVQRASRGRPASAPARSVVDPRTGQRRPVFRPCGFAEVPMRTPDGEVAPPPELPGVKRPQSALVTRRELAGAAGGSSVRFSPSVIGPISEEAASRPGSRPLSPSTRPLSPGGSPQKLSSSANTAVPASAPLV